MKNSVEILRAICFNEEGMSSLELDGFDFTEKEIEFMIEFKKIYEIGETQLKKFLDLLEDEGSELDEYSIQYYVNQLSNGALRNILLPLLIKDDGSIRLYFSKRPDILGVLGNSELTTVNSTVLEGYKNPISCRVDTFNKLPNFMQEMVIQSSDVVEDVYKTSMRSSVVIDNTLPLIDKSNQERYSEEPTGERVTKSHGNYIIKDSYYFTKMSNIRGGILEKVKKDLGEENYRLYEANRLYNPFDPEKNTSQTSKHVVKETVIDVLFDLENNEYMTYNGNVTESLSGRILENDLFGNVYDSDQKRETLYKIPNITENEEYLLNSISGDDENGQLSEKDSDQEPD
jgi:hypothetical protein